MKNDLKVHSLTYAPKFPSTWTRVLDEILPQFVKERFSPQESWKKKPFSQTDVDFFSKGLLELSDFFTEDRQGSRLPNYFTTARFRSSYFLYFFALQGAKFLTLFDRYPAAVEAALQHATKEKAEKKVLRIIDVGSGPGTASIAFLMSIFDRYQSNRQLPFSIQMLWIDHNGAILKDGEIFLQSLLNAFPEFKGNIQLKTEVRSWWQHPRDFQFDASLVLFGNVLNESPADPRIFLQGLAPFLKNPQGGGVLMVEPAFKSAAQRLSQIRDELMPHPLWGPCLHVEACPLAEGRDWCHFSVPAQLPGAFFRKFSIKLGGIRDWLKLSFLWIASKESSKNSKNQPISTNLAPVFRVVSDPMKTPRGVQNQLCKPHQVGWIPTPKFMLQRGDVIRYDLNQRDSLLQPKNKNARDGTDIRRPLHRTRLRK